MGAACYFLGSTHGSAGLCTRNRVSPLAGKATAEGLFYAAQYGDLATAQKALKKGIQVNIRDAIGRTPLTTAAFGGHAQLIRCLLDAGADPDEPDSSGWTPLHCAASGSHTHCVQMLLEAGANPNLRNEIGTAPLHHALVYPQMAKLLLDAGAEVDPMNNDGSTPLHWAANAGYANDTITLLLSRGADPTLENKLGLTPLQEAEKAQQKEAAALLRGPTEAKSRKVLLQLQVEQGVLTFRTAAGNVVATVDPKKEQPVQELPAVLLAALRAAAVEGAEKFKASDLRFVKPDGGLLDVGAAALPLGQQLGLQ